MRLASSASELTRKFRQLSSTRRVLPAVIVIGAQKAGTSSIFHYLRQHPQLIPPFHKKEIHFFDGGLDEKMDTFAKGEGWYRSHFPLQSEIDAESRAFEATPLYLFNPLCPLRISSLIPDAKLIVLLRNPVNRAISHYFHEKRGGHEPLSMIDAFYREESRLEPVIRSHDYKSKAFIHHSYKARGVYHLQLRRYFEIFSDEKIHVINSEDLFQHPDVVLRRVFEFIGVDRDFSVGDLLPRNRGANKKQVDDSVIEYLKEYFDPHNRELYKLLGKTYCW